MASLITGYVPPMPPFPSRIWVPDQASADDDDDDIHDTGPQQQPRNPHGDAQMPPGAPDLDDANYIRPAGAPQGYRRVWSWGGYLLHRIRGFAPDPGIQLRTVTEELCRLVDWCLCDDPHYRPRLRVLEREIRAFMALQNWVSEDDNPFHPDGRRRQSPDDPRAADWVRKMVNLHHTYWQVPYDVLLNAII